MAFCTNCGEKLAEGTKFCANCGHAVNNNSANQRKTVYDGEIHKCPNCGETLCAFTGVCPACGHELRDTKVSGNLLDFVRKIEECDRLIQESADLRKTGWAAWNSTQKTWWVILNVFTFAIPILVSYLIMPMIRYFGVPKLTPEEKKKAELIENFPVPNDRESVLEALIFARSKVEFLETSGKDGKTPYWMRLWAAKAEQLFSKAELLFRGDLIAKQSKESVSASQRRYRKKLYVRAVIGVVMILVVLVVSFAIAGRDDQRLDGLIAQVELAMSEGDYEKAKITALLIVADETMTPRQAEKWEAARQELLGKITQKQLEVGELICIGLSSDDMLDLTAEIAFSTLQKKGFVDILMLPVEPGLGGLFTSEGEIKEISVDGILEFEATEVFSKKAKIVITYYSTEGT